MASSREHFSDAGTEVEKYLAQWKAERDAIRSEREAEEKRDEYEFQKAKQDIEAEFHQQRQMMAASGAQSLNLMDSYLADRRLNKLKVLQQEYDQRRDKRHAFYNKRELDHSESYSVQLSSRLRSIPLRTATTQPTSSSPSRMPPSPGQPSAMPSWQQRGQPSGPAFDNRMPPLSDPARYQFQTRSFHDGDQAHQFAQQRPYLPGHYSHHPSQQRPAHEGYTMPVPMERPNLRWAPTQLPSNAMEMAGRHSLPGQKANHKQILPSSLTAEHEHVIDPLNVVASAKRKADLEPGPSEQGFPKRTRSVGPQEVIDIPQGPGEKSQAPAQAPSENVDAQISSPRPPPPKKNPKRSIDFDEVYQNGQAEYKHIIIEYPQGEGNWYILKCDEHGVHFNLNPLHGAAKHLHSNQHSNMSKEHSLAIRELGHLVWDCDAAQAAKNNEAVKKAFEQGYKPFNRNQLTKTERRSMGFTDPDTVPVRKTTGSTGRKPGPDGVPARSTKQFPGVVYPVDAELYLGYWSKNKTRYAVMLLPRGDLGPTGIVGTLKDTGLLEKAPKCYTVDKATREITGWAEGYEDGGQLVTKREFPVMYFDGNLSVGWLRAKDLSLFDFESPNRKSIPNYDEARNKYAVARQFSSYEAMKEYRREQGLPPKRYSSVRQPPPKPEPLPTPSSLGEVPIEAAVETQAIQAAVETQAQAAVETQAQAADDPNSTGMAAQNPSSTGMAAQKGNISETGHHAPQDVEMHDVSGLGDETESYHESDASDVPGSGDDDVEMANTESRRTSVSKQGLARETGEATNTDKRPTPGSAPNPDISALAAQAYARSATMATPGSRQPVETVRHSKESSVAVGIAQGNEDATIPPKETADPSASLDSIDRRMNSDSDSSSESSSGSRRVLKIHARRSGGLQTSENPSLARTTVPAPVADDITVANDTARSGHTTPRAASSIVHRESEPAKTAGSGGLAIGQAGEYAFGPSPGETHAESLRAVSSDAIISPVLSQKKEEAPSASLEVEGPRQPTPNVPATDVGKGDPAPASALSETTSGSALSTPRASPTPVTTASAASQAASRDSTPTILRPDEMGQSGRWRVVRSESGQQIALPPQPSQPAVESSITASTPAISASAGPSKEASVSATATPIPDDSRANTPLPGKSAPYGQTAEEYFELAYYEDNEGRSFHKQKTGPFLRLAVNKQAKRVETSLREPVHMRIDPHEISRVIVEPLDDSNGAACVVSLLLNDGASGPKEQKLVFETSNAMGREETGRIHARRFCRWVKGVNGAIDYRNKSFDSNSRAITSYVRR